MGGRAVLAWVAQARPGTPPPVAMRPSHDVGAGDASGSGGRGAPGAVDGEG